MAWREQLQPASFRGVPFLVDSHEATLGRRVAVHEFPLRDQPYAEDLGRRGREFTVEAYVLGADYLVQRDRLIAAVERPGPDRLVHPYLGELQVTVLECALRESTNEGGVARLTLKFLEAGASVFPARTSSTRAPVAAARDAALSALQSGFTGGDRAYAMQGRPAFVAAAAQGIVQQAVARMQQALGAARGAVSAVADVQRRINAIEQGVLALVYAPAELGQELLASVRGIVRDVALGPRDALALARRFYDFGFDLDAVLQTTPDRQQQARNQDALVRLVRAGAVCEAAGSAAALDFESFQEAAAVREELAATLAALMEREDVDDALYGTLRTLRAAVARDIGARGADLARVVSFTPPATLPALVVAHLVYADATRGDEIVARNDAAHPGFLPSGVALEVLSDA